MSHPLYVALIDIVRDVLPIGAFDWQNVTEEYNRQTRQNRLMEGLRRKFFSLKNTRPPTGIRLLRYIMMLYSLISCLLGDHEPSPIVERAREIWVLIERRAHAVEFDDNAAAQGDAAPPADGDGDELATGATEPAANDDANDGAASDATADLTAPAAANGGTDADAEAALNVAAEDAAAAGFLGGEDGATQTYANLGTLRRDPPPAYNDVGGNAAAATAAAADDDDDDDLPSLPPPPSHRGTAATSNSVDLTAAAPPRRPSSTPRAVGAPTPAPSRRSGGAQRQAQAYNNRLGRDDAALETIDPSRLSSRTTLSQTTTRRARVSDAIEDSLQRVEDVHGDQSAADTRMDMGSLMMMEMRMAREDRRDRQEQQQAQQQREDRRERMEREERRAERAQQRREAQQFQFMLMAMFNGNNGRTNAMASMPVAGPPPPLDDYETFNADERVDVESED